MTEDSSSLPSSPDPLAWQPPQLPAGVPDCLRVRFVLMLGQEVERQKRLHGSSPLLDLLVKPLLKKLSAVPSDELKSEVERLGRGLDWVRSAPRG